MQRACEKFVTGSRIQKPAVLQQKRQGNPWIFGDEAFFTSKITSPQREEKLSGVQLQSEVLIILCHIQ